MTAWIFTGCGALGSYQAAAGSRLARSSGYPKKIYGISSGAVNAFGFGYLGAVGASDFWNSISKFSDAFKFNTFTWPWRDGMCRPGDKLVKAMRLGIETTRIPIIPITVFTMDIKTGEAVRHDIDYRTSPDRALEIGIGSCAIAGIVQSHKGHVDAGFRLLAPLKHAIEDGHTDIVLISGRPLDERTIRPTLKLKAAAAGYHMIDVALSEILRRDLAELERRNFLPEYKKINLRIIQPKKSLGGPLDFHLCKSFFQAGVADIA